METSEINSEQLAAELEATQSQLMTLQARLKAAENSLSEASNLITEQNKSLKMLSSEINKQQRQSRINQIKIFILITIKGKNALKSKNWKLFY